MNGYEWCQVPGKFPCEVAFVMCRGHFRSGGQVYCCTYNDRGMHGHVLLRTHEGMGMFRYCCFSRSGVAALIQCVEGFQLSKRQKIIRQVDRCAVLNLPKVKELPRQLTKNEKRVLRSRIKRERDIELLIIG